jgi:uncharacterized membrane protein
LNGSTVSLRPPALALYFALLALTLGWEAWLAPSRYPVFWLTLKLVPLLLLLPGLWRDRPRSFVLAGLLMPLYFTEGVVLAWTLRAEPLSVFGTLPLAWIEIVVAVAFIVSAGLHARRLLGQAH